MSFRRLNSYLSRSQVREYLEYITRFGTDSIEEAPDSVNSDAPIESRVGSTINSIKEFHVQRDHGNKLTACSYSLSSNDTLPELPAESSVVGIIYMSKAKDYSGEVDNLEGESLEADIGDAVWFSAESWPSLKLGATQEGTNHRFFVFWKDK